ncbi:MAG TPA: septal ring lytic transglycosylase RlpA family protein [Candidatus Limnocylindrales bacterium]|nr:septal ring lytic transglycosylase RlpA family protein [Candidatus Limnocylindrales bacterium]
MRRPRVVASVALIAALATVAVPGSVGSQGPSPASQIDATLFQAVDAASIDGTAVTTPNLDPAYQSDGALRDNSVLLDPDQRPAPAGRPDAAAIQPAAPVGSVAIPQWHVDGNVSWYGPGFYGKRTACGYAMTESLVGVAHRTLPCGTRVTFRNPINGRTVTARVVDRGPYVGGRIWDLTGGLCLALGHCYTGSIAWKLA